MGGRSERRLRRRVRGEERVSEEERCVGRGVDVRGRRVREEG